MINKTDLFIYCDWLIDNNIDPDKLRIIISHISSGIVGVSQLGTDINDDDGFGDGTMGGYGFGSDDDGFSGDGYGYGYGSDDNGDGGGYGFGSDGGSSGNGDGGWYGGGVGCGCDFESN